MSDHSWGQKVVSLMPHSTQPSMVIGKSSKTNELVRRNDLNFKKNMRFTGVGHFICNINAPLNELQVCWRQSKKILSGKF